MEPPWLKYPEIPRFSIHWRMGGGEDYFRGACQMFADLTPVEQEAYVLRYPEPPEWIGWYDVARSYASPP
jgi:hypothetical protein